MTVMKIRREAESRFVSIRSLLFALQEEIERGVDEHDEHIEDQRDGKQRLPLQAGGVGHLARHGCGEKAHAFKQRRHVRRVARDHHDGHGLADGPADAEHDGGRDAALGRRGRHAEPGLDRCRAEGQRRVFILLRHGVERVDGDLDDGRQDHDGKNDDGREQARAVRHVKQLPDPRHQHQHADKAIDDRRDAREQADRGFHDGAELFGHHFRQEHGRQKADRHADQDRAAGAVDAREDEGENAEFRFRRRRGPFAAEQELAKPDLRDGGQAGNDQIHGDQQHAADRDES